MKTQPRADLANCQLKLQVPQMVVAGRSTSGATTHI
jgi:hypothetical protein